MISTNIIMLRSSFYIKNLKKEKKASSLIILKDISNHSKMLNMGREFVGNASHELRTPITIIKGYTEILLEGEGIDSVMQQAILEKISASCLRMEHLVKHLLRLTDLENCEFEGFGKVDIHRMIEDIS